MLSRLCPRVCGGLLLFGLLVISAGCGPDYKARATVKGTVSFAGKNLTAGTVMFHGKNNLSGSATIDKNGNYKMNDAPLGEVKVTVFVPKMPPGGTKRMKMLGGDKKKSKELKEMKSVDPETGKSIAIMGDMPDNILPIPDRFASVETSGLTYTVQKGEHTFDIPLKP